MTNETNKVQVNPIKKLSKDLKETIVSINTNEAKYLVNNYYQMQQYRIEAANQIRALQGSDEEPHEMLQWYLSNASQIEDELKKALDVYTDGLYIGRWLKKNKGIGPVIAAGLISNIDITKAPTAGHLWSYAGLNDNNRPWLGREKSAQIIKDVVGDAKVITEEHLIKISEISKWKFSYLSEKCLKNGKYNKENLRKAMSVIPYNSTLKTLCWKIGESFVKVSNNGSTYGKLYQDRKAYETIKNDNLDYADQAAKALEEKNYGKDTEAYKAYSKGKLPPAQINRRSQRYAVKIFLSHLFDEMYRDTYSIEPPTPYVIQHCGHTDLILPEVPSFKDKE